MMSRVPGKTSKVNNIASVLKTDTGGLVEYTKANGRTFVKELGKTTRRNFGTCLAPIHIGAAVKDFKRLFIKNTSLCKPARGRIWADT
jgi:hypothetical protein